MKKNKINLVPKNPFENLEKALANFSKNLSNAFEEIGRLSVKGLERMENNSNNDQNKRI